MGRHTNYLLIWLIQEDGVVGLGIRQLYTIASISCIYYRHVGESLLCLVTVSLSMRQ